jgi:hypothetical protein
LLKGLFYFLPITQEDVSAKVQLVNILFTKFTILFTIQIPCAEGHLSNFVAPTLKGHEK